MLALVKRESAQQSTSLQCPRQQVVFGLDKFTRDILVEMQGKANACWEEIITNVCTSCAPDLTSSCVLLLLAEIVFARLSPFLFLILSKNCFVLQFLFVDLSFRLNIRLITPCYLVLERNLIEIFGFCSESLSLTQVSCELEWITKQHSFRLERKFTLRRFSAAIHSRKKYWSNW
jgi:hypothetical protein